MTDKHMSLEEILQALEGKTYSELRGTIAGQIFWLYKSVEKLKIEDGQLYAYDAPKGLRAEWVLYDDITLPVDEDHLYYDPKAYLRCARYHLWPLGPCENIGGDVDALGIVHDGRLVALFANPDEIMPGTMNGGGTPEKERAKAWEAMRRTAEHHWPGHRLINVSTDDGYSSEACTYRGLERSYPDWPERT